MKRILVHAYNTAKPINEELAKFFTPCGRNAIWPGDAYHLSVERITGHAPNTVSGDFYLVPNDEFAGGWIVFRRIFAAERTDDRKDEGTDLLSEIVSPSTADDLWAWLNDPVSQALFLLSPDVDLHDAMGIGFSPERLAAPELQVPMTLHCYCKDIVWTRDNPQFRCEPRNYQHVALGFGDLMIGHIQGEGYGERSKIGYPHLTVPEARAFAHEMVQRWNNHIALEAQLKRAKEILGEAIEKSGYKINGPTDSRAAEDGEPVWVCEARGVIANREGQS